MNRRRKQQLKWRVEVFLQQYARKNAPGYDPNDRRYDREVEALVKRMTPEELAELLAEDDELDQADPDSSAND
jgi:hypothetical protein